MPSRNVLKEYAPDSYYHIYNRGVNKRLIFSDNKDYTVFLSLLKRYLSKQPCLNKVGGEYPHYYEKIELLAFCLMPNHFHLLVYQHSEEQAIARFLQSVCTAYTMYFNKKNERVGPLFQGRFRASKISSDNYLQHISRYIHLNPVDYKKYEWSSLPYYLQNHKAEWLVPKRIREIFENDNYSAFLEDYEDYRRSLEEIKYELANS